MKFLRISLSIFLLAAYIFTGSLYAQNSSSEKFSYISPVPGAKFVNPKNNIAFRHGEVFDQISALNAEITVSGTISGDISGHIKLSLDSKTLIFLPDHPFKYGEKVNVVLNAGLKTIGGKILSGASFYFEVMKMDNTPLLLELQQEELEQESLELQSQETSDPQGLYPKSNQIITGNRVLPEGFPKIVINAFDNPSPHYRFVTPAPSGYKWVIMIDNYGTPVFYREWTGNCNNLSTTAHNQIFHGNMGHEDPQDDSYLVLDTKFNPVDSLKFGNGYSLDGHDALLLENGNHLLFAKDPQIVGMDTIVPGGNPDATVTGFVVQELDADHNVIFQWLSWDHFEITDAVGVDFTGAKIDYIHLNAIELDLDGNILLCCRHMEEITKIDRVTGDIIWRFGPLSKNNMFTYTNDTIGFSHAHDVRIRENGHMTLYDNGNLHDPGFSQGAEYALDQENLIATLVWNYVREPVLHSISRGSTRRLDNGNSIIGWGKSTEPSGTEVNPDKEITWEVSFLQKAVSYRVLSFDWRTDFFETNVDTIDFGEYTGYTAIPRIFTITNNSSQDMEITSTHNHWDSYTFATPLPLSIESGETKQVLVEFWPTTMEGQINDVLTLNYESFFADTLPQLIARQVYLKGFVEDENPPTASIIPPDGATDVSQSATINIGFDEPVVKTNGSTINASDIASMIVFREDNATGADVEFSAYINPLKNEFILTPDHLKPLQQYYVELKSSKVADNSGNILAESVASTFNTADEQAPVVVVFPEDESIGVSTLTSITFNFDEAVKKAEGGEITDEYLQEIILLKETDIEGADVGFTATINEDKTEITVTPDTLMILQQYYVELAGGTVSDEYDNVVSGSVTSTFTTMDDTGVDDFTLSNKVSVFPNPHMGEISLNFETGGSKNIQVMDAYGKLVYSIEDIKDPYHKIDISDEPNGIYLIRVIFKGQNKTIDLKTIKL